MSLVVRHIAPHLFTRSKSGYRPPRHSPLSSITVNTPDNTSGPEISQLSGNCSTDSSGGSFPFSIGNHDSFGTDSSSSMHSSYQQNFGPASSSPQQSLSRPKNHSRSQSQSYESRTMDLTDMHPPQSPDSFHSSSVQGHSSFGQKPREVEIKEEKAKLEKNIVKLEVKMEKKEDEWKLEREKLEMKIDKKEEEWKLEREKLEKERKEEREKLEKERKEERENWR
ncbi:uncharacterized protein C8R40DRAFT_888983 [Lentinula edodes]|uniref:uncharacterized protein n=1 Tax=Lentinula edodes TaxID=5353 RepID=UPI001E8CEE1D|nr:uncharacterized protein C8R40DRAFT_888983 [Lentinula edodes]KAH7867918.1 hypothetical protein C8R40DRAFT_888983 [Lentinula edodes]